MDINIVILKFHDDFAYPLGFNDPPDYINFCSFGWIQGDVIYVELKVGIDIISSPCTP